MAMIAFVACQSCGKELIAVPGRAAVDQDIPQLVHCDTEGGGCGKWVAVRFTLTAEIVMTETRGGK